MFSGFCQYIPVVSILYFGLFNPFHYSSLPLYLPAPPFQPLSIHILIFPTFTSYVMWYYWCSIIFPSFPSFSEFQRVVPLLQMSSTYEFIYDHFCCCVCLSFGSIFHIWEKTCDHCLFEPGLLHLTWCPPIVCIYL
jgi:hypothetical protein